MERRLVESTIIIEGLSTDAQTIKTQMEDRDANKGEENHTTVAGSELQGDNAKPESEATYFVEFPTEEKEDEEKEGLALQPIEENKLALSLTTCMVINKRNSLEFLQHDKEIENQQ